MRALLGILAFALLAGTVAPAQEAAPKGQDPEKYTIELKHLKGEDHRFEMKMKIETEFTGMQMEQEMGLTYSQKVADVTAEGVATLKVTYDRVVFKMGAPMEMEYDSDKKKDAKKDDEDEEDQENMMSDMITKAMGRMVGKTMTVKMNKAGECLSVEGLDSFKGDEDKDGKGGLPGMKDTFNEDQIKQMLQMSYGIFPKNPVAKGESWQNDVPMNMQGLGKMDFTVKCTLKDVQEKDGKKIAVISQDMKAAPKKGEAKKEEKKEEKKGDEDEEGEGMMPFGKPEFKDMKVKGEMLWDLTNGRLISSTGDMTMEMTMGEQEISTKINMVLKEVPAKVAPVPAEKK